MPTDSKKRDEKSDHPSPPCIEKDGERNISTNQHLTSLLVEQQHPLQYQPNATVTPSPHSGQFKFVTPEIDTVLPQPIFETPIISSISNPRKTTSSLTHGHEIHKMLTAQQYPADATPLNVLHQNQQQQQQQQKQQQQTTMSVRPSTINYSNLHQHQQPIPRIYEQHHHTSGVASPLRPYSNIVSEVVVPSPAAVGSYKPIKIDYDKTKQQGRGRDNSDEYSLDTLIPKKRLKTQYRDSEMEDGIIQTDGNKFRNNPEIIYGDIHTSPSKINTLLQPSHFPKLEVEQLMTPMSKSGIDKFTDPDTSTTHHLTEAPFPCSPTGPKGISSASPSVSDLRLKSPTKFENIVMAMGSTETPAEKVRITTVTRPTIEKRSQNIHATSPTRIHSQKEDSRSNKQEGTHHYAPDTLSELSTNMKTPSTTKSNPTMTAEITTHQEQGNCQQRRHNKRKEGNDYHSTIWTYYAPEEAVKNCPETELDLSALPTTRKQK